MQVLKVGDNNNLSWYGACTFCGSISKASHADVESVVKVVRSGGEVKMTAVHSCQQCEVPAAVCFHREDTEDGMAVKKQIERTELVSV